MLHSGLVKGSCWSIEGSSVTGQPETDLSTTAKLKATPVPNRKSKAIDIRTALSLDGGVAVVFQVVPNGKVEEEQVQIPIAIQVLKERRVQIVGRNVIGSLQA